MNESIDLRKRILKMRENNNSMLSTVKSEQIKEDIKKEDITKEAKSEDVVLKNKEKLNSTNTKKTFVEDENNEEQSLIKNVITSHIQAVSQHPNKQNNKDTANTNEVQFRIIANKFNEAVEVILQLSEKVEKLEDTVYKNHKENKKGNGFFYFINIKIVFTLILIPLLILGVFTIPFDFITMKLIFSDIISLM